MSTAAQRAARDKVINLYIEAGSRGSVEAAAVRDQLQKDVDAARVAYIEAATLYGASYENDVKRAAAELQAVRDQLQALRAEIAAHRDNIANVERCGTAEKAAQLRADLQGIKQQAAELEKAAAELGAYIPAGDPALLKAAEKADKSWRSQKAIAERITAGIDKRLEARAADLKKARQEIGPGVWSAVYIPPAMKVSELRKRGRRGHQLRDILQQREKAEAFITELRDRITRSAADPEQ